MIIDCHSHIWPALSRLGQAQDFSCLGGSSSPSATPQDHLDSSRPARAVLVLGFISHKLQAEIPNSIIKDYVSEHPGKLIGFAGIDPTQAGYLQETRRLVEDEGFKGLVLSPACQGFHPCDSRAMKLYEYAQELNMPVYFLNGEQLPVLADLSFTQTIALDEVARAFPNLKIVISHLGFPWIEQNLALLAKHANIFTDVAGLSGKPWQAYRSLSLAHEYGVIEKLLFASDFPNATVKVAAETLYNLNKITLDSVLPAVPREHLRGIVERNSLELLGLNMPLPAELPSESIPENSS